MTTSKLPARPSLESLRKQGKKLARDIAAGDAAAIARARAQLPQAELPLSQRDATWCWRANMGFPRLEGPAYENDLHQAPRAPSNSLWAYSRFTGLMEFAQRQQLDLLVAFSNNRVRASQRRRRS